MFCILKAAEVALHLNSVHRWCVTGTPIQKGLEGNVGWLLLSCIASVPIQAKSSTRYDHVKIVARVQDWRRRCWRWGLWLNLHTSGICRKLFHLYRIAYYAGLTFNLPSRPLIVTRYNEWYQWIVNWLCLDIYGLLLFLGVDPYCHYKWWKTLLYEPYRNGQRQALYDILAKIMWRSSKKDVIHEV